MRYAMTMALSNIIALMRIISTRAGAYPLKPILIGMAKIPTPNKLPATNRDAGRMVFHEIVVAWVFYIVIHHIRLLFFFMFFMLQLRAAENTHLKTLSLTVSPQLRAARITCFEI